MINGMNQFFDQLSVNGSVYYILLYAPIGMAVFCLAVRVMAGLSYQSAYITFILSRKPLNEKNDYKKIKSRLFAKMAEEYISILEKDISHVEAGFLAVKHIEKMSFLGLSFDSLMKWVDAIESIMPFFFIGAAIIFGDQVFLLLLIVLWVLLKTIGLFLDTGRIKDKLGYELTVYLEKEIGQFYIRDVSASVLNFKGEIRTLLLDQQNSIKETLNDLRESVSETTRHSGEMMVKAVAEVAGGMKDIAEPLQAPIRQWGETIRENSRKEQSFIKEMLNEFSEQLVRANQTVNQEMLATIEKTMDKLSEIHTFFQGPMEKWAATMERTETSQAIVMQASEMLSNTISRFETMAASFTDSLQSYQKSLLSDGQTQSSEVDKLTSLVANLTEASKNLAVYANTFGDELHLLKTNQNALETSFQQYQVALEDISKNIAQTMGNILSYQSEAVVQHLKTNMEEMAQKIPGDISSEKLYDLLDEMRVQRKIELNTIKRFKEQIELLYEELMKEKGNV